jgi:hypothetical protein
MCETLDRGRGFLKEFVVFNKDGGMRIFSKSLLQNPRI